MPGCAASNTCKNLDFLGELSYLLILLQAINIIKVGLVSRMRGYRRWKLLGCFVALWFAAPLLPVDAQVPKFGVAVRAGVARLDGDVNIKSLRPEVSGALLFTLRPHLRLSGEAGWADLALGTLPDTSVLRTFPVALNLTLRFAPYSEVTPFVTLGGGGTFWKHLDKRTHQTLRRPDLSENNFDYFLQTVGGLEFVLSTRASWFLGAAYRYSLTDKLDALVTGKQNDAILSAFTGLTFHFGKIADDADGDGVINRYDLNSKVSEDRDGYLDHDGVPEKRMGGNIADYVNTEGQQNGTDKVPPIVIHEPILRAAAGNRLKLYAEIFENQKLLKAAILYRPANTRKWLVEPMQAMKGNYYAGTIPATAVQKNGVEYCVVAVDEAISGVGYSGVPDRPNFVRVHGRETTWRVVTGLAAAAGWGTAAYLVFRK